MASAAEQLAANISWGAFSKAKELQQRILFTLIILIVYRLGTYIPLPGINPEQLQAIVTRNDSGVLSVFNMFSGGAIGRMAIFALGIMPYISASIIMQLMTTMVPSLEALKKEGEVGRKKINQYTRYGTVLLAGLQATGTAYALQSTEGLVLEPGLFFIASAVITLVGGTVLLMWLGEQITARGVGNGISLIIFVGIIAELPGALAGFLSAQRETGDVLIVLGVLVMVFAVLAFVVFVERAQRRILIQYPQRQIGQKVYKGDSSHLPLKVNTAGVIPPIFASSLLLLPTSVIQLQGASGEGGVLTEVAAYLGRGSPVYLALFAGLIIFFCFFYTAIVFNPEEVADNLKKHGGYVPGVKPGKNTAAYLDFVLTRLTVVGAIYLALICVLPEVFIADLGNAVFFGGTSLLIIVSVTMDTISQVHSHLVAHQYEGLIKKSKLRGGRRR